MEISTILEEFLQLPYAKKVDKEHLTVRCPICGDSKKHHDKSHCVIWHKEEQPLIYHCWICENSGLVDNSFLSSLGIQESEILTSIHAHNKKYAKTTSNKINAYGKVTVPIHVPKLKDSHKLDYIRERLQIPFTTDSLECLRVISSIRDFMAVNNLEVHGKYRDWVRTLEKDYVGFLSSQKGHIIFRSTNPNSKFRYVVYNIFNTPIQPAKFYSIPSKLDILSPKLTLNITEGIFDILGVFFHVHNANTENMLYSAVCGSGYRSVIEYFIKIGCIDNLHIQIYSDIDKKPNFYRNLTQLKNWIQDLSIYYNNAKGEKDFGVPKISIIPVKAKFIF